MSIRFGALKATLDRAGKRIPDLDLAIAAHALAHDAALVTADVKHMTRIPGLLIEDWLS